MKNKKKVLICATTFPRFKGDSEPRFILDFAKSLLPFCDVTVLTPASAKAREREILEGVKVIRFHYMKDRTLETLTAPGAIVSRIRLKKSRALLVPFFIKAFTAEIAKRAGYFDVIQANWVIPTGMIAATAIDKFKKNNKKAGQGHKIPKLVITCHGSDVNTLNNKFFKKLKKEALKKAWGVTAVSNDLMKSVNGIYENKNRAVISMGVDTKEFSPDNKVPEFFTSEIVAGFKTFGVSGDDAKVILFVGRLVKWKGAEYIIRAMAGITGAHLVIVGDGEERERLEKLASGLSDKLKNIRSAISFAGARYHKELKSFYASSDIFVMPGIVDKDGAKEGFGLVVLEAFASGLPVVASEIGGIVEIVKNEKNGILVKQKDVKGLAFAVNRLLKDDEFRERLKSGAVRTAASYDYSVIGKRYADFMGLK